MFFKLFVFLLIFNILPIPLFQVGVFIVILLALFAFIQSLLKYKSIQVALMSIATLFIQVIAYGLGTLSGMFQKFVLRKNESKGYVKNYYK